MFKSGDLMDSGGWVVGTKSEITLKWSDKKVTQTTSETNNHPARPYTAYRRQLLRTLTSVILTQFRSGKPTEQQVFFPQRRKHEDKLVLLFQEHMTGRVWMEFQAPHIATL